MKEKKLLLYVLFFVVVFLFLSCPNSVTENNESSEENKVSIKDVDNDDVIDTKKYQKFLVEIENPLMISAGSVNNFVIKEDGTLWTWGDNQYGKLGLGDTTNKNIPTQVGINNSWKYVSGGISHTLAVKTDGTLWAWGRNYYRELGLGDTTDRNIPTQVGSATDWKSVSAGPEHSIGIRTDGTLWAWGRNRYGELGLGSTIDKNIPTKVGSATDWKSVSTGYYHSVAVKTDGTLWAWGRKDNGRLGLGITTDKNIPTQVGSDTDWKSVSTGYYHSVAVKTNGTLWAWGRNDNGRLGLGDTNIGFDDESKNRNIPTQVGSDTDWESASTGPYYGFGIKTDGTLWAWGSNARGKLGLGGVDTSDKTSPTKLGTDTMWKAVFPGGGQTFAVKTNGNLWAWGHSLPFFTTNKNIPQQITNIKK